MNSNTWWGNVVKQLKASVPEELAELLEAASTKSGRSLSAEVCARIEESFAKESVDKPTRDFLDGLALLPAAIELETGAAWHKHAGAHAVFRQAILSRLARLKPPGSIAFGKRPHQAIPGSDDPEEIGIWIEVQLHEHPDFTTSPFRRALEQSFREMMEFHRKSEKEGEKS